MLNIEQYLASHVVEWILDGITALLIIVCSTLFFIGTKRPIVRILHTHDVDNYLIDIIVNSLYRSIIVIFALVTALAQLGVNILAAMTGFGVIGLAIGFAAKDSLGNFIAGFMILWDKPFLVGDWIEVDDQFGQVQAITLRSTRIHTNNNYHVVIPNQNIINNMVINHHHGKPVRTITYLYVRYDEDLERAMSLLEDVVQQIEVVIDQPPVGSGISNIENGLAKIAVLTWTANARDAIGLDGTVRRLGIEALRKAGYSTPYPVTLSTAPRAKRIKK